MNRLFWLVLRGMRAPHAVAGRRMIDHQATVELPYATRRALDHTAFTDFLGAMWTLIVLLFTLVWAVVYCAGVLVAAAAIPVAMYLIFR